MRAKAIDIGETQTEFEWVEFEDDHEPYFFAVLELQNGQLLYGIFGEDVETNEYASPLALARNEDVARQIANILNGATAQLASVTAERDALKAENAAIRQVNERITQDEILLTQANDSLKAQLAEVKEELSDAIRFNEARRKD